MFDETYSDSLDAKVQDLKRSMESLYDTLLSSSALGGGATFLTGMITGIDTIVEKFGVLPTLITTIGTLMLATSKSFGVFTEKAKNMVVLMADGTTTLRQEMSRSFNVIRDSSNGAILKVNALGISFDVVKIKALALQSVVSLGLSFAVAALVSAIGKLGKELFSTSNTMEECAESAKNLSTSLNDIKSQNDLVSQYEKLNKQLEDTSLKSEDIKSLNDQITNIKSQLGQDKDYYWILNDENLTLDQQLQKLKEIRDLKLREDARELNKEIGSQGKANQKFDQLQTDIDLYNKYTQALKEADSQGNTFVDGRQVKADSLKKIIESDLIPRIQDNSIWLEQWNGNMKMIEDSGVKTSKSQVALSTDIMNTVDSIRSSTQALQENTQAQLENSLGDSPTRSKGEILQSASQEIEVTAKISDTTKNELIALFPEYKEIFLGVNVDEAKEKIKELQDIEIEAKVKADGLAGLEQFLTKIGSSADNSKKIIDGFNKSLEEGVSVSQSLQRSYGTVYSDAANNIEDLVKMQKELNKEKQLTPNIIEQIINKYPEMIDSMGSVDELQKAITSGLKEQEGVAKEAYLNMMSNSESFFKNNIKNNQSWITAQKSVNQTLMNLHNIMLNTNAKNYNGYYKALAESYSQDISNSKTVAQSKIAIESNLLKAMTDAWATYYETQRVAQQIQASGMDNWISQAPGGSEYLESLKQQAIAEKQKAEALKQAYEQAKNALNGFNFKVPDIAGGTIGGGSTGGGSTGGGSSSEDNYKATIDRYRQQQIELEKINKLLELNDILSRNANSKDKVRLAQERIELLKKQKAALEALNTEQKKELSETKSSIQKYGGTFDSNGNLTNYQQVLAKYTGESAKALEALINKYDDLNDKIFDTSNQIEDMKNATIDAYNAIGDELKKQWEKETDALKSEIEKRKDALNKQRDDEDYEDQRFEAQKKLTDLQQKRAEALRAGNISEVNKLDEEIRQAQKELNDLIKDKEFDNTNNRFDEEIDKLDKDLEDKIAAMEKEIENGNLMEYIKKNGINLATIFDDVNNMSKSVNSNMMTIGSSIDSWSDSLSTFKSNLASIQSSLSLGLKSGITDVSSKSKGTTINSPLINLTVQGDGATVVNEDRIRYLLDEYSSKILMQINDIY